MQAQYDTQCYSSRLMSLGYCHTIPNPYSTVADPRCATSGVDDFSGSSFSRGSSSLAYLPEDYRYMDDPEACPDDGNGLGNSFSSSPSPSSSSSMMMMYAHAASSQTMNMGYGGSDGTGIIGYTENGGDHREEGPAFYQNAAAAAVPRWEWDCPPPAMPYQQHPHPPQQPQPQPPADIPFNTITSTIKTAAVIQQDFTTSSYHPVHSSPTTATHPVMPISSSSLLSSSPGERQNEQISHAQIMLDTAVPRPLTASSPVRRVASSAKSAAAAAVPNTDVLLREKKHACTMCHKRFDRPSTLRKHLLVHTGEKAFVCETCGRRFGVASNLNRHARRCILKPANAVPAAAAASVTAPVSPSTSLGSISVAEVAEMSVRDHNTSNGGRVRVPKRGRTLSSTGSESASSSSSSSLSPSSSSSPSSSHPHSSSSSSLSAQRTNTSGPTTSTNQKQPGQKRRRRAPSPSLWVPWSLRAFNLACEELYLSAPVPLPPVRRNLPTEERDSWDENGSSSPSSRPYHPQEWKGVLPGPGFGNAFGLGGRDIRNVNLGGSGGIMLGRVLVC